MFEFMTIRELYEMFLSNQIMELESMSMCNYRDGSERIAVMANLVLLNLMMEHILKMYNLFITEQRSENFEEVRHYRTGTALE